MKAMGVIDCKASCTTGTKATNVTPIQIQKIVVRAKTDDTVSTASPKSSVSSKTSSGCSLKLFGPSPAETPTFLLEHVLSFLPWSQRGRDLLAISPAFSAALPRSPNSVYWSCLCVRLGADA